MIKICMQSWSLVMCIVSMVGDVLGVLCEVVEGCEVE